MLQRQRRFRFGKNHLFNNLYTSAGPSYCVGLGANTVTVQDTIEASAGPT